MKTTKKYTKGTKKKLIIMRNISINLIFAYTN